jgi:cytochrome P450
MLLHTLFQWLWDAPLTVASYCLLSVLCYFAYTAFESLILEPYQRLRLLRQQGIRGPAFTPILGIARLRKSYADAGRLLQLGQDLRRQFGALTAYTLGTNVVLQTSDPDIILAAWKTQRGEYEKSEMTKARLGPLLTLDSLLLVDEERHAHHRKLLAPAFHFAQLKSMVSIFSEETQQAIDRIAPVASSGWSEVELHRFWCDLTFRIIISCAFGSSLQHIPHAAATVHHGLTTVLSLMTQRSLSLVSHLPIVRSLPILGKRESEEGVAAMQSVIMQMIRDRQEGRSQSQCGGADLLDLLLNAKDAETGEGFSPDLIRAEAMTFVLGGHETSSSLLTSVMRDLVPRPQLYRQCRQEVQRVTQGQPLQAHHLPDLQLLDAVIHESFRLYPPGPVLLIQAKHSHVLTPAADSGKPQVFIPARTNIAADLYSMQRSPELWGETAAQFDEHRWLKGSAAYNKGAHAIAFNGFSVGPRNCIGSQFAMMEVKLILAMVVSQLDMELLEGQDERLVVRLTIEPMNGLRARVKRAEQ